MLNKLDLRSKIKTIKEYLILLKEFFKNLVIVLNFVIDTIILICIFCIDIFLRLIKSAILFLLFRFKVFKFTFKSRKNTLLKWYIEKVKNHVHIITKDWIQLIEEENSYYKKLYINKKKNISNEIEEIKKSEMKESLNYNIDQLDQNYENYNYSEKKSFPDLKVEYANEMYKYRDLIDGPGEKYYVDSFIPTSFCTVEYPNNFENTEFVGSYYPLQLLNFILEPRTKKRSIHSQDLEYLYELKNINLTQENAYTYFKLKFVQQDFSQSNLWKLQDSQLQDGFGIRLPTDSCCMLVDVPFFMSNEEMIEILELIYSKYIVEIKVLTEKERLEVLNLTRNFFCVLEGELVLPQSSRVIEITFNSFPDPRLPYLKADIFNKKKVCL